MYSKQTAHANKQALLFAPGVCVLPSKADIRTHNNNGK